jgi:hypothetical protein
MGTILELFSANSWQRCHELKRAKGTCSGLFSTGRSTWSKVLPSS